MKRLVVTLGLALVPQLAAAQQAETVEYYGLDKIGSVRIVWDAAGNVVGRQDFTPFGTPVTVTPPVLKEGFGGQQKDGESDQSYFHARQFASRLGRFGQPDPLFSGLFSSGNQFGYAHQNPLVYVDPFGRRDCKQKRDGTWDCGFTDTETVPGGVILIGPMTESLSQPLFGGLTIAPALLNQRGDRRDQRLSSRQVTPVMTPGGPLDQKGGLTVTVGASVTAIAITGGTASGGFVIGSTGCEGGGLAGGGFSTIGAGGGGEGSAAIAVGFYREGVKQFRGKSGGLNVGYGPVSGSLQFNSNGDLIGFTVGFGEGAGASATVTSTGVAVASRGLNWNGTSCK